MVKIVLDKERNLRFNLTACKKFKELTGKSLLRMVNAADLDEEGISALIFCGLIHEDKELTIDQVADMVDTTNLIETLNTVSEELYSASAKVEKVEEKADIPLANTGLSVSSTPDYPMPNSGTLSQGN